MEKTITLDWDSIDDVKKHVYLLQKRRKTLMEKEGYKAIRFNGSFYNVTNLMPILEKMYDFQNRESSISNICFWQLNGHFLPVSQSMSAKVLEIDI